MFNDDSSLGVIRILLVSCLHAAFVFETIRTFVQLIKGNRLRCTIRKKTLIDAVLNVVVTAADPSYASTTDSQILPIS